jgi:hypothetical protein
MVIFLEIIFSVPLASNAYRGISVIQGEFPHIFLLFKVSFFRVNQITPDRITYLWAHKPKPVL